MHRSNSSGKAVLPHEVLRLLLACAGAQFCRTQGDQPTDGVNRKNQLVPGTAYSADHVDKLSVKVCQSKAGHDQQGV